MLASRERSSLGGRCLDRLPLSPAGKLRQRGSGASPGSPAGKRQVQPGAGRAVLGRRPSRCSGLPLGGGGFQKGHSGRWSGSGMLIQRPIEEARGFKAMDSCLEAGWGSVASDPRRGQGRPRVQWPLRQTLHSWSLTDLLVGSFG